MKSKLLLLAGLCYVLTANAQVDSTQHSPRLTTPTDTLHIGNMTIIRDSRLQGQYSEDNYDKNHHSFRYWRNHNKPSNISTNWCIIDLGFANFNDKTLYGTPAAQSFASGSSADWFNLRNIKSVDVNIWLFMQRLNVIKHVINLKYGLGIELNNYRFSSPIVFSENPATQVHYDSTRHFKKNKLAADYVTVPLMVNFNFTPHRREGFGLSAGISAGYLYSSRQKIITVEDGKKKTFKNFDLEPWKISYIGELQLGPIKLYGSYATKSMFKKGLDQTPYTVGIRLSNW